MENKNYIILPSFEAVNKFVVSLFPRHYKFYCLNSKNCDVLPHITKVCLDNHLNWLDTKVWPNENANEFLNYEVYDESLQKFALRAESSLEGFLFADLYSQQMKETVNNLSYIFDCCKKPTMVLYNDLLKFSGDMLNNIQAWANEVYVIIDLQTNNKITVLLNYSLKHNPVTYPGNTARKRQQIYRKGQRWANNFNDLDSNEKDYILMMLLSRYIEGDKL